jgi:hypothetical protein
MITKYTPKSGNLKHRGVLDFSPLGCYIFQGFVLLGLRLGIKTTESYAEVECLTDLVWRIPFLWGWRRR